ncbi:hypothetical protein [Renibacterium salmoninarum]|uniref:hypothetical protein n=1 Tax=Renibacterium salmoninarum TaxID=1646 RepID=UPI0011AB80AF|nr:hypothetical protein [Renibacterium salmoninarum]
MKTQKVRRYVVRSAKAAAGTMLAAATVAAMTPSRRCPLKQVRRRGSPERSKTWPARWPWAR